MAEPSAEPSVIVGIGELLWDVLPRGKQLGGAPVNFACHCQQLGSTAYPVSCIGQDDLGREIREALDSLHVDHAYVMGDPDHPTGTVQVTLDAKGKPSYEICEQVAWDHLQMSDALAALAGSADAACFGSLAQRNHVSRTTIREFLNLMRPESLRVFDVNLRQAFFSKEIIEDSLALANVLKLSDEELPVMVPWFNLSGSPLEQLQQLRAQFDLSLIAFTRGPDGSLLLGSDEIDDHPGCPGTAIDSVGAGDSFTAALCTGLLRQRPLSEINEHANRVGTFVCSQNGATPTLPPELISSS
ncbi:MAG: carbohydrate kinase [Verrucomicrobiae bacterium]|nr:carbohydrate kinase [Verrucomicrobiae bacterium]NNJ87668.1 carbohydrate kinase [Akkermansiaceae bacterium]